ncbi:hypothetical protein HYC85_012573 [Camellia sinensis]|uniref:ubiquitinyl hydrolase 1 n=1 Tax=Camellia sinensis TaxID=4442 RepID=A0A7J7HCB7_CAMSI|nr:hypothetical protein HYC85_012573 [Camellia sinensis]
MSRSQIPENKKKTHKIRLKFARIEKYARAEEDMPGTKTSEQEKRNGSPMRGRKIKLRLEPSKINRETKADNLGLNSTSATRSKLHVCKVQGTLRSASLISDRGAQMNEQRRFHHLRMPRYTDLIVGVPRVDEPPPESSLSVAGQPGAIYSAGALQLEFMAKKVKKKARSGYTEKRVSTLSQKTETVAQQSIPSTDDGLSVVKERKVCSHLDKGIDLAKISSRISSIERIRCEDCREGVVDRRASRGRGKQVKKKGGGSVDKKPESKAIWVCLECGHLSCGGIGFPTTPQTHAVPHARQTRHPLAIQFENLQLCWCFPCDTLIPVEKLEESGEQKDPLLDIVKLIKGQSFQGASVDVEDVYFGSGSVISEIKSENIINLLAMERLRNHFLELDESVGPLTISLKKLFIETSPEAGLRNVINPKFFFGCVCAKASQFRGHQQHDSHELLHCLLDGLCTEELSARKQTTSLENGIPSNLGPTFIDSIFGGQLSSTVSCLECGHSSTVFEPFLDLSLPVPTKKPPCKRAQPISQAKKPKLPPKRCGRIRPKLNRDADSVASDSVSVPSASGSSSCLVESTVPVKEKVGDALVDSTLFESVGPGTVADEKSSVSSNLDC